MPFLWTDRDKSDNNYATHIKVKTNGGGRIVS